MCEADFRLAALLSDIEDDFRVLLLSLVFGKAEKLSVTSQTTLFSGTSSTSFMVQECISW